MEITNKYVSLGAYPKLNNLKEIIKEIKDEKIILLFVNFLQKTSKKDNVNTNTNNEINKKYKFPV